MKKAIVFLTLLALVSCKERKAQTNQQAATPTDSVAQVNTVPDSTIYGKADDDLYVDFCRDYNKGRYFGT